MTRVGGVINPLLTDGLATSIGEATKGNTSAAGAQVRHQPRPLLDWSSVGQRQDRTHGP